MVVSEAPAAGFSRSTPIVTIAIPAYNHGRYLPEAIETVLGQDYPAIEIIVVDDGSTDDTAEVLKRYAGRIEAVSQTNAGQSAAINRAWRQARGELVAYLSADDRLKPRAVSTAVGAFTADPELVMVYGDFDLIDPSSAHIRRVRAPEFDYQAMVTDLVCAPGPGAFLRRTAVDRAGEWNTGFRQAPDFDYWLRFGMTGRCRRLPVALADLRVHPGSASFAPTDVPRAEEPIRIMTEFFARQDLTPALRSLQDASLSSANLLAARSHIRSGRYRAGARHLRVAASLSPRKLLTLRAARLLANACVNRFGHTLLWSVRRLRLRP